MGKKKGQVTLFIILGLVIVSFILVYFLWLKPHYFSSDGSNLEFESCAKEVMDKKINELGLTAGFSEQTMSYRFRNVNVPYLCYTNLYYVSCSNQKPFLKQHFESELKKAIQEGISKCYDSSVDELIDRGYEVKKGEITLEVFLEPGKNILEINAPTSVTRESTQTFTDFRIYLNSELYNILMISTSIVQSETNFGDADLNSLRFYYPDYSIEVFKESESNIDGVKKESAHVYIVENKLTKEKFQFAVRSFAWPAGFGVGEGLVL